MAVKGFKMAGSAIFGYKVVPVIDYGAKYAQGMKSVKKGVTETRASSNINCDKKLRKVLYSNKK